MSQHRWFTTLSLSLSPSPSPSPSFSLLFHLSPSHPPSLLIPLFSSLSPYPYLPLYPSLLFLSCRDFGYVSRDSTTRKHQCHIFRCAMPARVVARMLLESHQKARRRKSSAITTAKIGSTSNREPVGHDATPLTGIVGGHEQYERIPCVYIGSCDVPRGLGMDVLNEAVEQLAKEPEEWTDVIVDVAISSVTIHDHKVFI